MRFISVPAHFQTKSKQISVPKGKQVHVQCNVQGDNPIDIKWKIQATQQYLDESLDSRYIAEHRFILLHYTLTKVRPQFYS